MRTESFTDFEGISRFHFVSTVSENYRYDKERLDAGEGRCIGKSSEGRQIEFWLPLSQLRQIGTKTYAWVDESGTTRQEQLPVYEEI